MKPTLVILAAGMGSRYGGLKQIDGMGPNNELILDYSIYDALQAGFDKIVLIIRKDLEVVFRDKILSRFPKNIQIEFAYQELDALPDGFTTPVGREKPWGTGHAVWCAKEAVKEPFAVINADDFYGRDAFQKLANQLSRLDIKASDFCMVGYPLENTLSDHGTVSRGVCSETKGKLNSVVEYTNIEKKGSSILAKTGETETELAADTPVSLNCWGFTPKVFDFLEKDLISFLEQRLEEPKAEFFLPSVIDKAIRNKEAEVDLLTTNSHWYGVTYPEDRAFVQEQLRKAHENNTYPVTLRF
jgi:UTP-glucose-1-phosphate uridylyltransferase